MKSSDDKSYDQTRCDWRCHYQQNLINGVVPEQEPLETAEKADCEPTNEPLRDNLKHAGCCSPHSCGALVACALGTS
jgi:hypothetical protein